MFDTSNLENAEMMFYESKIPKVNVSNWTNPKLTNVSEMFNHFDGEIDISNFQTSAVESFDVMFANSTVTTLDLSSFDFSSIVFNNASGMFQHTPNLTTIYVSDNFDFTDYNPNPNTYSLFIETGSLMGGNGTNCIWNGSTNIVRDYYARIDKPGRPGCFTDIADKP